MDRLACDFLVLGAGLAGLSAGARAAEQGARVIVVEKQAQIGGSSALSGGVLWTVQSQRKMVYHTYGRPDLCEVLMERYPQALAWLRSRGVAMSHAMPVLNGRGYQIDILGHLTQCRLTIEQAGGYVALESEAERLLTDPDGRVTGALVRHADGDLEIAADWTLLATGGFQASPELRARYIHAHARDMLLRSNSASDGGGLKLGLSVGGRLDPENTGFYGHLVSASPAWGEPRLYTALSQYHSDLGVLIGEAGSRFCDESAGDHVNTRRVLEQPGARALLVWDARIHRENVITPLLDVAPPMDRMEVALEHGGEGAVADTLDEVAAFAGRHGFDQAQTLATLEAFRHDIQQAWERLDPPRVENPHPPQEPPFYALIVYPAITYTFAGLTIDPLARVLDADGRPVRGLLAAGADAGDVYRIGYAGGLCQAITLGLCAAETRRSAP